MLLNNVTLLVTTLIIINGYNCDLKNKKCVTNNDCESDYLICKNNICTQKDIFPLRLKEFIGLFVLIILILLSLMGGIGGGAIIIPIALIFLNFNTKEAAALSNILIFISAFISYLFNLSKRDPQKKTKTIVDYDMILLFNPNLLLGSYFGIIINTMLPDLIILILVCIILFMSGAKILHKSIKLHKLENEKNKIIPYTNNVIINKLDDINTENNNNNKQILKQNTLDSEEVKAIIKIESNNFNITNVIIILITLILTILITIFKGKSVTKKSMIGLYKCTTNDWVLFGIYIFFIFVIIIIGSIIVYKRMQNKIKNNFIYDHELKFDLKKIIIINIFSFLVGFISSVTGLGGGVLINPFLIILGYSPVVSAGTSFFLIWISKLSAVIGNIVEKQIIWDYAIFYGFFILINSIGSKFFIDYVLKKFKKQSIIGFVFVFIMILSILVIGIYSGISFKGRDDILTAKSYCN